MQSLASRLAFRSIASGAMDDDDWDLEMELLCLPATGGSVRQMQRLAARISAACTGVPPHVVELGKLPCDSHRERDMHRWANRQAWRDLLPKPYTFKMPHTPNMMRETEVDYFALLPHEVFANLSKYPELLNELLLGKPGDLEKFWHETAKTTWFQRHPLEDLKANPNNYIPIGVHGDDAGVYNQQNNVLVLTWGSVVQELLTLDSRILFTAVMLNTAVPGKTTEVLYKVFAWSLNCLASGVFPSEDHNGKAFSTDYHPDRHALRGHPLNQSGLRGVWSELRGDWKWQAECLHLDQHYNKNYVCHLCRAHCKIERLWYTQFNRAAHTRKTLVRWSQFRDWYADRYERPELFKIIGFDVWRCWCDAMHCLDLGVYESVAGSCLVELVEEKVWGTVDEDDAYKLAHEEYKGWCRGRGLAPAPRFERARLQKGQTDFPKFSQQSAKAAATRHIVRWLRAVLDKPGVSAGEHGAKRLAMMDAFVKFEDICDKNSRWLPGRDIEGMAEKMEEALLHMNALHAEAAASGKFLWKLTPKAHMATHLVFDFAASGVNPRRITCYADEDMVGRCKKIILRCHGATAGRNLMLRYAILVCTRWWTCLKRLRGLRAE